MEPVHIIGAPSVNAVLAGHCDELLLLSRDYGLRLLAPDSQYAGEWKAVLHGDNMEGVVFVEGVGLIICEDRAPSRLLIFLKLKTWEDIRSAFMD